MISTMLVRRIGGRLPEVGGDSSGVAGQGCETSGGVCWWGCFAREGGHVISSRILSTTRLVSSIPHSVRCRLATISTPHCTRLDLRTISSWANPYSFNALPRQHHATTRISCPKNDTVSTTSYPGFPTSHTGSHLTSQKRRLDSPTTATTTPTRTYTS